MKYRPHRSARWQWQWQHELRWWKFMTRKGYPCADEIVYKARKLRDLDA